jgi:GNAT superfamily N-acetyltransferase
MDFGTYSGIGFELRENPGRAEIHEVRGRLEDWNRPFLEIAEEPQFMIRAMARDGVLAGGIVCTVVGRWLEVDYLWVDEAERGSGLGTRLLAAAEGEGRGRGCERAFLTTFGFQAKPFYELNGYRVVHVQEGYPRVNAKYFMEKDLGIP